MALLAAGSDLFDSLLHHLLIPFLITLAFFGIVTGLTKLVKPGVGRWWLHSRFRRRFQSLSKAGLILFIGVASNLLVLLMCMPLLRVPAGAGIKPMGLVFFSLVLNAAALALCRVVARDSCRPDGSRLLAGAAVCLCLIPFVGGIMLMHAIAALRDLQFG